MTPDPARVEVAQASRILAQHGIMDAFGHISRRVPGRTGRFYMSRSLAPALVTVADIVELDLDGVAVAPPDARVFLERFIHAEIYRARSDVAAIVHSHAPQVVPFTVVPGARVGAICHVCGFLDGTAEPFDIADHAGPASDLLVRSSELGRHFAEHLGAQPVGLMRAHGFTAVGATVAEAVFRAVYTARNCEIQLSALRLGAPSFLNAEEARACDATTAGQADRAWGLWLHQLGEQQQEIFGDR